MTMNELRESVERWRDHALIAVFREARTLGLLGDPFTDAVGSALGDISLDEAIAALRAEAKRRDAGAV